MTTSPIPWHAGRSSTQRSPHVVHLVPALFGPRGIVGGAERYAFELARRMSEVTPTSLVSFAEQSSVEQVDRLRVVLIGQPWYIRNQRSNPFSLDLFRRLAEADVVHCHQLHLIASSAAAAFCRMSGRKVFVSDLGGGGWDISGYVSTDRWYHGHLHISEYSKSISGQNNQFWSHVILGGVDTNRFSPDLATPRDGSILFVGRLLPHKGVNYLIESLPDDLRLLIIGKPYHASFLSDLHKLARGKQVRFRHDCSDADIIDAYRRSLCIVLPSVYRDLYGGTSLVPELLGQTLLEGMSCGTPAICTDVASMPEVVEDGVSGFVVPPNDPAAIREKLVLLKSRPELLNKMGVASRQRILDRFTWPVVVQRCLDAYCGS